MIGNKKSSSQKKHQRKTRLKYRIKEFLGFKNKEDKNPEDEPWVIIDTSLKCHDDHSVSELGTDEENNSKAVRSASERSKNDPEEVYDNFDFRGSCESSNTLTPDTVSPASSRRIELSSQFIEAEVQDSKESYRTHDKLKDKYYIERVDDYKNENYPLPSPKSCEKRITFSLVEEEKSVTEPEPLWVHRIVEVPEQPVEKSAVEARISDGEELPEMVNILQPNEMVEVCNATIMIEDNIPPPELNLPLISTTENETTVNEPSVNSSYSNPDYEPIEVSSSAIIFPPYSSTLNYYFPQRRLEVISEESSDLSENNEEKRERPWENSDLIKKANDIKSIPNDWYGSDEGIDTSWRNGKSIEEMSDVAVISDSHSDSDLISDDMRMSVVITENDIIKYNVSGSKSKEQLGNQQSNKIEKVIGKPPLNVYSHRIDLKPLVPKDVHVQPKTVLLTKNEEQLINKLEMLNKESVLKANEKRSDVPGSKVICKIIKQKESNLASRNTGDSVRCIVVAGKTTAVSISNTNAAGSKSKITNRGSIDTKSPNKDATELPCNFIEQKGVNLQVKSESNDVNSSSKRNNTVGTSLQKTCTQETSLSNENKYPSQCNKYMKTIPSNSVLKNVVFSYYNSQNELKKTVLPTNVSEPQKSGVEVNTSIVKAGSERDVEFVYIDSSDSDAISNKSIKSTSDRRTFAVDKKEDGEELGDSQTDWSKQTDSTKKHIIKEDINAINQSIKEISNICNERTSGKVNATNLKGINTILPNLLSPVFYRKCSPNKPSVGKRRFSYPMSEQDVKKTCFNCSSFSEKDIILTNNKKPIKNGSVFFSNLITPFKKISSKTHASTADKPSLRSLPNTPPLNILSFQLRDRQESTESISLEFSDGSVSSESYTLPDVAPDIEVLSDESSDTIKYFHAPGRSPKFVPRSPVEVSDIVDLHKKFVERRGYHEASPILKRRTQQENNKTPEPDLIALSKCSKERNEQAYTPELLVEAANLLALHKYHESRQQKMKMEKEESKESSSPTLKHSDNDCNTLNSVNKFKYGENVLKTSVEGATNIGMNENIIEYKHFNKSVSTDNETVGKSRLLELFQKLESKSSTAECTVPEPFPYWLIFQDESTESVIEPSRETVTPVCGKSEEVLHDVKAQINDSADDNASQKSFDSELPDPSVAECEIPSFDKTLVSVIKSGPLPPGEIFQRRMYEEYLDKMAELAERRNMKIIKISDCPNSVNVASETQTQPLESEFMSKLKERNEKLGILIDDDESDNRVTRETDDKPELPKHLKELMEITEECGGESSCI